MKLSITRRSLLAMGSSAVLGFVTLKDAVVTGALGQQARAQEGAQTKDNTPLPDRGSGCVNGCSRFRWIFEQWLRLEWETTGATEKNTAEAIR